MTEREELEMWKEMYLHLLRKTERAINLLVRAEQDTEDKYIEAGHSREEYSTDTVCAKQWVPILTTGDPEPTGLARVFRFSRDDIAETARRAAEQEDNDV